MRTNLPQWIHYHKITVEKKKSPRVRKRHIRVKTKTLSFVSINVANLIMAVHLVFFDRRMMAREAMNTL